MDIFNDFLSNRHIFKIVFTIIYNLNDKIFVHQRVTYFLLK